MSLINLQLAKSYLDVIHDLDDEKLQMLLDAAEDEAEQYIQRPLQNILPINTPEWPSEYNSELPSETPSEQNELPASAKLGVLMLLQASYQASPDDAEKLRKGAEIKLTPFRTGWGV